MTVTAGTDSRAGRHRRPRSPTAGGGACLRPHARPRARDPWTKLRGAPGRRRRVDLAGRPAPGRLGRPRQGLARSPTSTAPSTSTSTPASARCSSATPTRRVVEAVQDRVALGTHFAQPYRDIDPGRPTSWPVASTCPVALRQLGHRGDDGRHPPDAGGDGPQEDHQGRGQVPRPPRHACRSRCTPTLEDAGPARRIRPRSPTTARVLPEVAGPHGRRALRRPRRRRAGAARAPGRDRRDDHRAGDDEHRRHPAARRLPRRRSRSCSTRTASCSRIDEVKTGLTTRRAAPPGASA